MPRWLQIGTILAMGRAGFVMLGRVRVLFGVLVLCVVVLILAAVGVARHIVRHRRAARSQSGQHDETI